MRSNVEEGVALGEWNVLSGNFLFLVSGPPWCPCWQDRGNKEEPHAPLYSLQTKYEVCAWLSAQCRWACLAWVLVAYIQSHGLWSQEILGIWHGYTKIISTSELFHLPAVWLEQKYATMVHLGLHTCKSGVSTGKFHRPRLIGIAKASLCDPR